MTYKRKKIDKDRDIHFNADVLFQVQKLPCKNGLFVSLIKYKTTAVELIFRHPHTLNTAVTVTWNLLLLKLLRSKEGLVKAAAPAQPCFFYFIKLFSKKSKKSSYQEKDNSS